ncbi:unnamed protein product [Aureobasidium mustum]|uniref:Uncharacterized protein n=1 Tax=Aureobasidium mustum TaxID=2773714 RepID=A0A9N8K6S8_9PEZI|nr:unnamed protein product [Aureobasidium mustum]
MSSRSPLESALDVEWILEEPCVVKWEDSNHESKTLGLKAHPVTLWVGARKKDHSGTLDELLKAQRNNVQHGWLGGRVFLGQLQTPGHVLMKRQLPSDKAWSGNPLHLLMEVQSLSKAPYFQLYVSNQKHVRKVMSRLEHELPKTLPAVHIDLNKIFGGRDGAWDAWKLPPPYDQALAQPTGTLRGLSTPPSLKRLRHEDTSTNKRTRASEWEWYEANYPFGSPTEENTPTSIRERISQQSTEDNQSIRQGQLTPEAETPRSHHLPPLGESFRDQSTQVNSSPPGCQLTPTRHSPVNHNNANNIEDMQVPPCTASVASTASLDQLNIKPTIFTTKPQAPPPLNIALTLTDLERLITTTIQAQIPAIAAQVQSQNLAAELTAWAQPSIADYIDTHMPAIMHEAVSAHVSDVNDEFESASASLHETKDEAITEIRSAEESGIEEVHRESQAAVETLQEESHRLSGVLDDKCTELEDRLEARTSSSAPPVYSKQPPTVANSAKEAVKLFERFHRGRLASDEQVRVLLSIAKFNNAEVFAAADWESQKMLVAHWSGRKDYTPPSPPLSRSAE